MLNSFFDKYIFTNTLKYTHNNFFLVDVPFAIIPVDTLTSIAASNDLELHKKIYSLVKENTQKNFLPRFKVFELDKKKQLELIRTFFVASGWGDIQVIDLTSESKRAILVLNNSPFVSALKGKASLPVDLFLRGVIAGLFSNIFSENIDCVEVECAALSGERCKLIVKPQGEFDFSNKMVQDQLSV